MVDEKMVLFGPMAKPPGEDAIRRVYRAPIMGELIKNPNKHLHLILDIAIESISKERDTDKILFLAEKLGIKSKGEK